MATPNEGVGDLEFLRRVVTVEPPLWLVPPPELSRSVRSASQHLFSSLKHFTPKSPFDQLLTDGFDAEQIWQQIDLQSQPLISSLRRELNRFEKNPEEISKIFGKMEVVKGDREALEENGHGLEDNLELCNESEDIDDDLEGLDEDDMEDDEADNDEEDDKEAGDDDEDDDDEGDDGEEETEENEGGSGGIQDKFFKMNDLEKFIEEAEEAEYGSNQKKKKKVDGPKKKKKGGNEIDMDEEDTDEEDAELGVLELGNFENDLADKMMYADFFEPKNKKVLKKKPSWIDETLDTVGDDEEEEEEEDEGFGSQKKGIPSKKENLSTHEREVEKIQNKIEELEKANLDPKTWTMKGEVTAGKRPMNSLLEVDLDFEHNVKPPPVITEEVTASLEDIIQKRILEGNFDDVQKAPSLPSKAPREMKELDENKSKKGLGEIYEEEYVEKTSSTYVPSSFTDEQKKEANMLFKKLCLKLDALSHFHFTPKPVIEDMSIQANVPALAIEEIAPMAVSDATMLAPEEVFSGKGDVKEETELTKAERKRRRAKKKEFAKKQRLNLVDPVAAKQAIEAARRMSLKQRKRVKDPLLAGEEA